MIRAINRHRPSSTKCTMSINTTLLQMREVFWFLHKRLRRGKNNFNNYKSSGLGSTFEEYLSQSVEWDVKNFAKQYTDTMGINPEYGGS